MPDITIAKAHASYVPDNGVATNRQSALRLIHQLVSLQGVTKRHMTEQLKIGLWKWTEAEGISPNRKYNTRYFSAEVMAQQSPASINHEHVWTMKNHVKALLGRRWTLAELEDHLTRYGVACIVTVEEHGQLSGSKLDGWARYQEVGVPVFDRATQSWLDFGAIRDGEVVGRVEATPARTTSRADVAELIAERAEADTAALLVRLLRMARFASAVAVPSVKVSGDVAPYFRIHDTLIEEPTGAVAFPHWTGQIDFALLSEDLPNWVSGDRRVKILKQPKYAVSLRIHDEESLGLGEDLLFLALEKLRNAARS